MGAEELVRAEEHRPVDGDARHHVDRVRRRAADVRLRLHRGRGVHVADDHRARVLGLPCAQLLGGDRVGQRAACGRVGDQHRLVLAEDLGRLRHEVDAAVDDGRLLHVGSDPAERQRVADVVRHVLDLGPLVVVGEDDRVALRERSDVGRPARVLSPRRADTTHGADRTRLPAARRSGRAVADGRPSVRDRLPTDRWPACHGGRATSSHRLRSAVMGDIAVVTGANSGIGRAAALHLAGVGVHGVRHGARRRSRREAPGSRGGGRDAGAAGHPGRRR